MVEDEVVPPALFNHCLAVYHGMREQATLGDVAPLNDEDVEQGLVYQGFTTKLFSDIGLAVPYYSRVLKSLKRMGCIVQLRRGGSTTPSRWQLITEPTMEQFITTESVQQQTEHVRNSDRKSRLEAVEDLVAVTVARANSADKKATDFLELAIALDAKLERIIELNKLESE